MRDVAIIVLAGAMSYALMYFAIARNRDEPEPEPAEGYFGMAKRYATNTYNALTGTYAAAKSGASAAASAIADVHSKTVSTILAADDAVRNVDTSDLKVPDTPLPRVTPFVGHVFNLKNSGTSTIDYDTDKEDKEAAKKFDFSWVPKPLPKEDNGMTMIPFYNLTPKAPPPDKGTSMLEAAMQYMSSP